MNFKKLFIFISALIITTFIVNVSTIQGVVPIQTNYEHTFFYAELEGSGNNPEAYQFGTTSDGLPNPRFLSNYANLPSDCPLDDIWCKSRYVRQGQFNLDLVNTNDEKLANLVLEGIVWITTDKDATQPVLKFYNNTAAVLAYGDANIITEQGKEEEFSVASGTYKILLEYYYYTATSTPPSSGAIIFFKETGSNVQLKQFTIEVDKIISENKIIITAPAHRIINEITQNVEETINLANWGNDKGKIIYNLDYQTFRQAANGTISSIKIGTIKLMNDTHYWLIDGYVKSRYNPSENVSRQNLYGYVIEYGQRNDVVKMTIFGKVSTALYELYHTLVELFVNNHLDKSTLTGDSGSYGDYQINSQTPGTGYLVFRKPGFIGTTTEEFTMGVENKEVNVQLEPAPEIAGWISGTIRNASNGQPYTEEIELWVHKTQNDEVIQKRKVSGGTYEFVGLIDYYMSGGDTYYLSVPGCTVYGGRNIKVLAGQGTTKNIFVGCEVQ